ncbi:class I glutamine amidotransferase-like protein [Diplogelasinospora grovesii]|uniref:Class I glutamine amidotransferase-like protein n=1 Tax=Diplogelasinospora grovesii TaxID=303347 RepID=A0AAN6S5R1_9PEZI|nr:class I glutamine amidotransferase-like protein [Diplogelasinospora grovesii]
MARTQIKIGVFLPSEAQLLDTACIDIFGSMSYEYLSRLPDLVPAALYNLAPSVVIYYISTVQPGELIELSAGMKVACTHNLSHPDVAPGKLDIVLVPGPDPNMTWDKPVTNWLAAHGAQETTDVLSVCTGIYLCGEAGLLRGKKVCGPRGLQGQLKKKFEGATWLGEELRWVKDGNFWSSGGVTNGNDLVAAYCRQDSRFPGPVCEIGLRLTDVGDRPQKYEVGQTAFTLGVVWQVVKAVFMGIGKSKTA